METPVLDLLSNPERWTQHVLARDNRGRITEPKNPNACSWCLIGAIIACYEDRDPVIAKLAIDPSLVSLFNDTSSHEEVVNLLKEAQI